MRILLSAFIIFFACMPLLGQNKIEWSDEYKLSVSDYDAEAPNTGQQQTVLGHFYIGYQIANYDLMTTKNLNKKVSCYMQKDASYIDKGDSSSTAELIRYQQLIFDTYEISARKLREKFYEERKRLLWEGAEVLYEEVSRDHTSLIAKIVRETKHGQEVDQIEKWESWINSELALLSDYCKECRPKKKKKNKQK